MCKLHMKPSDIYLDADFAGGSCSSTFHQFRTAAGVGQLVSGQNASYDLQNVHSLPQAHACRHTPGLYAH